MKTISDKVIIKIDGDDSGFQKNLTSIGTVAKKSLGITFKGIAAISGAFSVATGAALKFSGDLEQNLGGSEAVFGKYADEIQNKAKKAFKNMGLSTSNYLATANKMGALFKGAGFEMEEAADISAEAMQRAADIASIMGIDVSMAMESIAGAAKGNFTMMDNLGVAMNDTTLNAYALEKGIGKTTQQMTNQEKVALAMEMFLDRTAYAAGNYAKENETLAGALGTAKAALQNFMSGEGSVEDLSEALTNASEVISKNIETLAPELAEGFIEIVRSLIPVIPEIIRQLLPSVIDTIEELFSEAIEVIPDLLTELVNGIGDAVPTVKPLMDLIAALAENVDALTIVVSQGAAAFVTYKSSLMAMNTIQQIRNWVSATSKAVAAYTVALQANNAMAIRGGTINGLLLSTMSPLQVVYGVLTGKIKLADAAQNKFNLTILNNPYALVAAAIAALVAGIVAYAATHKSATEEIIESLEDTRKAHEDAIKAIDDTQSSSLAEAEVAKTLKDELFKLDAQLKSGTLTQEEAKIAQDNFNVAADKLNEIIPGITSSLYDETGAINVQYDAVNDLTDSYYKLAVAKATSAAYEEKMTETAKSLIDAKDNLNQAKKTQEAAYEQWGEDKSQIGKWQRDDADRTLKRAYEEVDKYQDELAGYKDGWIETNKELSALMENLGFDDTDSSDSGSKRTTGSGGGSGTSSKSSEDRITDSLDAIIDRCVSAQDEAELLYDIWEETYGEGASLQEKTAKKTELLSTKINAQEKIVEETKKAYQQAKNELGETSETTLELKNSVLEATKELAGMKNELKEVSDTLELTRQETESNIELIEAKYELWCSATKNTATEEEKAAKKTEYLNAKIEQQGRYVAELEKRYNETVAKYGETAEASIELEKQLYKEKDAWVDLNNELAEHNRLEQHEIADAAKKFNDYIRDNAEKLMSENGFTYETVVEIAAKVSGYDKVLKQAENISNNIDEIVNENPEATEETAEVMQDEAKKAGESAAESFVKTFVAEMGEVPDGFFDYGEKSAESFEKGFIKNLHKIMDEIKTRIQEEIDVIISSAAKKEANNIINTTNVTNNSTYVVQPSSGESTQQQLQAVSAYQKKNEILRN